MARLLDKFRAYNRRLNSLSFGLDGDTQKDYVALVSRSATAAQVVIDLGASVANLVDELPEVRVAGPLVVAVDIDHDVLVRNRSQSKQAADAESLPFRDETVDLTVACSVLEHIENPGVAFSEYCRVLRKGGRFVFYTPHRYSYVAAIARMTGLSDAFGCCRRVSLRKRRTFGRRSIEQYQGRPLALWKRLSAHIIGIEYWGSLLHDFPASTDSFCLYCFSQSGSKIPLAPPNVR